jgi:uncharacterized membrane protein YfcA
VHKPLFGL